MCFSDFIEEGSVLLRDDSFSIRCDITITEDIGSKETKGDQFVAIPPSNLNLHFGDLLTKHGSSRRDISGRWAEVHSS